MIVMSLRYLPERTPTADQGSALPQLYVRAVVRDAQFRAPDHTNPHWAVPLTSGDAPPSLPTKLPAPQFKLLPLFLSYIPTTLQSSTASQATSKPHHKHTSYSLHHPQWSPSSKSRSLFSLTPPFTPTLHHGSRTDLVYRNAASSVTESVSGKGAEASKETHKSMKLHYLNLSQHI